MFPDTSYQIGCVYPPLIIQIPILDFQKILNIVKYDHIMGNGSHRGYSDNNYESGDKTYMKWEGTHNTEVLPIVKTKNGVF